MEQMQVLGEKIAGFPGYGDDDARRRSDELVRSYLGEALAALQERLQPPGGGDATRLEDLILRSAFTNQDAFEDYEERAREDADFGAMAAADVAVVDLAGQAPAADAAGLTAYLDRVTQALDARDAAMENRVSYK